jgi:hypothetical protein
MKRFNHIFFTVVIVLILFSAVAYGITWTENKRLTHNEGYSWSSAIAVDGPNIYVVWADNSQGNFKIFFKRSGDGGATWTKRKRLSSNSVGSEDPAIAVDGSNIYVVWSDDTKGNYEIYFRKSVDGGITWTKKKRLTNNAGGSWCPAIAVDGPNIYVVWEDTTKGNYEIYFKKSVDGGITWTKNKRLTNNEGVSGLPAIAVDGPNIYVVWEDYTPGNYEIYFKAGVLF